jgi:phosphatidylserine synthase
MYFAHPSDDYELRINFNNFILFLLSFIPISQSRTQRIQSLFWSCNTLFLVGVVVVVVVFLLVLVLHLPIAWKILFAHELSAMMRKYSKHENDHHKQIPVYKLYYRTGANQIQKRRF